MATSKQPSKQDKDLAALGADASKMGKELDASFRSIGSTIQNNILANMGSMNDAAKDLIDQTKMLGEATKGVGKNIDALNKGMLTTEDIAEKLETVEIKRKQLMKELLAAARSGMLTSRQAFSIGKDINKQATQQREILKQQLQIGKLLEQQRENELKIQQIVNQKMEKYGNIMKGINKIPLIGQLIQSEKVLAKMKETAEKGGGGLKVAFTGVTESVKSIGDTLTSLPFMIGGIISLLKVAYQLATEYEQKQFDAARDLGVSVQRGKQLRDHFVNMMQNNIMLGLTADEIQKAYVGVQDAVGVIVKQSDEFAITTALIERRTGATAEHMAMLQYYALKSGQSMKGAFASVVGAAKATGARLKIEMSEKQILDAMEKTSATVLSNFHGNFKALARAVVEAKALGTTLDKINGTQDQFLDFETSIAKQFEAEVLLGRQLDLTRARQLAENHNTLGLMRELKSLMGSQFDYQKLGTIEQQAYAEALGMSRDTMLEMFVTADKTQEMGKAAGEELAAQAAHQKNIEESMGAQAVASIGMASTAERMNVLFESIKTKIAQWLQQYLPLVEEALKWLSHTENLRKVFVAIAKVIGGIVGFSLGWKAASAATAMIQNAQLRTMARQNQEITKQLALERAKQAQNLAQTEVDIVDAGAKATAGSGYLGPGALAIGTLAIATLSAYLASSALGSAAESVGGGGEEPSAPSYENVGDALISSGGGLLISGPKGSFKTDPADQILAAPNAGKMVGGGPVQIVANLVIDGQVLATKVINHTPENHSTYLDNNTALA